MAQGWKATTTIQHGDPDGTVRIFKPGDLVSGLTKEQMAELWEAGALEETVMADSVAVAPETPTATGGSVESGTAGGSTEGAPAA